MGYKKYLGMVLILFVKLAVVANSAFGAWGTATVDSTGNTGHNSSIAVGTSGAAYISYNDATGDDLEYATNVSGAWVTTTVDSALNTGQETSIAVGTSGAVYISYYDVTNTALKYATNVSGAWVTTTLDNAGGYTSMAVGTSGAAYISYYGNPYLEYATNVSGSWGTTTLDSTWTTGKYTSIAVGTSGAVYISYYYETGGALKYATNVSGSWGTTTVDSTTSVNTGQETSIALGSEYITYYDFTNKDLMYATTATPTVTTGAASNVTTNSATLAGTVNGRGLSTTAMFSYGAASGSYTGTSTTQSVSGTAVSIGISGLSSGTTYYYRIAANSGAGTSTGSEASFTTTSAPVGEPTPTRDTLTVTSTSPASGATGVGTNTAVSATFSLLMNGSTLTPDTFKLQSDGGAVTGSVTTNADTATFTPVSFLAYDTTYTATITTGAQAANFAGTTLDANHSWTFTTESAPIVPTPTPTATPSPTPAATPTAVSTATPAPVSTPTQSPTPTITPAVSPTATPTPVAVVADFTASPTARKKPLAVQFTDQSTGDISGWKWNFGDGAADTAQNPSHTYTTKGNYTVSLAVSGSYGADTKTIRNYITVTDKEASRITLSLSPSEITFGESLSLTGQISPAIQEDVLLAFRNQNGGTDTATVESGTDGSFSLKNYFPSSGGSWEASASWAGNDDYEDAESNPVPFAVDPAKVELTIAPSLSTLQTGKTVDITGTVTVTPDNNMTREKFLDEELNLLRLTPDGNYEDPIAKQAILSEEKLGYQFKDVALSDLGTWEVWTGLKKLPIKPPCRQTKPSVTVTISYTNS